MLRRKKEMDDETWWGLAMAMLMISSVISLLCIRFMWAHYMPETDAHPSSPFRAPLDLEDDEADIYVVTAPFLEEEKECRQREEAVA
jgi:hypothetical protein